MSRSELLKEASGDFAKLMMDAILAKARIELQVENDGSDAETKRNNMKLIEFSHQNLQQHISLTDDEIIWAFKTHLVEDDFDE